MRCRSISTVLCLAALASASCRVSADAAAEDAPAYRSVLIQGVPHIRQRPDFCGEACVEMALRKLGKSWTQDDVFAASQLDPALGRGCYTAELVRALRHIGFRPGDAVYEIAADSHRAGLERQWKALHDDLAAGVPSIVCTHWDASAGASEHFRLVVGYDADKDEVLYQEPAEDDGGYRRMKRARLLTLWPLKYDRKTWTVIRMPLRPGTIAARPPSVTRSDRTGRSERVQRRSRFGPADFAQHVRALREKLTGRGFTILVETPFVVVGDESRRMVERRAKQTVKWCVDHFRRSYFAKDPTEIIDVWLFKDEKSYRSHAKEFFDDEPGTPFGYYSSEHKALVMNIRTGGGTLVHEIVHPFIAANFPDCPAWFNEGLASLYEQCGERDGKIRGATNWRLAGLQRAIRAASVPSFPTLTSTTTHEFYGEDPGTNYSQARYLCYWLQEKGRLRDFYRRFRRDVKKDPTGVETLRAVIGERDLDAWKKKWESWVLGLRFAG